ncbi:YobI family P-loop NTPase [Mycoplasma sp. CSL7503-lung]|uniref:YobI family P-loop NTPase n=1 Tax=Mycoplasma sp. CSL7503-lung TaxID=536372 RepID=UPI0021CFAA36|nr:hypothetical protein [Mycoplasma sp. CSL7503-lung]MCU4706361.1 hypothetical protein [Mycoplasma sp. CSL7503-lung]
MNNKTNVIKNEDKIKIKTLIANLWLNWSYLSIFLVGDNKEIKPDKIGKYLSLLFDELISSKISDNKNWEIYYDWYLWQKNNENNVDNNNQQINNLIKFFQNISKQNVLKIIIFSIEFVQKYIIYDAEEKTFNNEEARIFVLFIKKQLHKSKFDKINKYYNDQYCNNFRYLELFLSDIEYNKVEDWKRNLYINFRLKNKKWYKDDAFLFYSFNKLLINLELMLNSSWMNLVADFKNIAKQSIIYNRKNIGKLNNLEQDEEQIFSKFIYINPNLILNPDESLDVKTIISPFESIDSQDLQWSFKELKDFIYNENNEKENNFKELVNKKKKNNHSSNKINSNLQLDEIKSNINTIDDEEIKFYSNKILIQINENKDKNILITGEALSGKSSILKSFLYDKKNKDFVKISFSNINQVKDNDNSINENLFEKSLVRQMIYQLDNNYYTGKTILKNKKNKIGLFLRTLLSVFISILVMLIWIVKFDYINFDVETIWNQVTSNWKNTLFFISIWILLFFATFIFVTLITKNFWRIKSVKIIGNEINLNTESNLLDANIDVIVDIISKSNKKIIIFEDINWNIPESIFLKLFEINSLLNSRKDDEKITFIYVVDSSVLEDEFKTRFFDSIIDVKNNFKDIDKSIISKKILDKITLSKRKNIKSLVLNNFALFQRNKIEEVRKIVDDYYDFLSNWKEIDIILNEISNFEMITKGLFLKEILRNDLRLKDEIEKIKKLININQQNILEKETDEDFKKIAFLWNKIQNFITLKVPKNDNYIKLQKYVDKSIYIRNNIYKNYPTHAIVDELSDILVFAFSKKINFYVMDKLVKKYLIRFMYFRLYLIHLISISYLKHDKKQDLLLDDEKICNYLELNDRIKEKNKYNEILGLKKEIFVRLIIKDLFYYSEELTKQKIYNMFNSKEEVNKIKFILFYILLFPESIDKNNDNNTNNINDLAFKFMQKLYIKADEAINSFVMKHSLKTLDNIKNILINKNNKLSSSKLIDLTNSKKFTNLQVQKTQGVNVKQNNINFDNKHFKDYKYTNANNYDLISDKKIENKGTFITIFNELKKELEISENNTNNLNINEENITTKKEGISDKTYYLLTQLIYDGSISVNFDSYTIPSKIDYSLETNNTTCFCVDHLFERKINRSFLLRETKRCFIVDLSDIYEIFSEIEFESNKISDYRSIIYEFYNNWHNINQKVVPSFEMTELDNKLNEVFESLNNNYKK